MLHLVLADWICLWYICEYLGITKLTPKPQKTKQKHKQNKTNKQSTITEKLTYSSCFVNSSISNPGILALNCSSMYFSIREVCGQTKSNTVQQLIGKTIIILPAKLGVDNVLIIHTKLRDKNCLMIQINIQRGLKKTTKRDQCFERFYIS